MSASPNWVRTALPVARRPIKCRLYMIWSDMRVRCNNPKSVNYPWYGAKGVRVCAEWDDYGAFREWAIANGYTKQGTLDRKDSSGNYEPGNCRWATREQQQTNTGSTASRDRCPNGHVRSGSRKKRFARDAQTAGPMSRF
jgi:hypothetical protein